MKTHTKALAKVAPKSSQQPIQKTLRRHSISNNFQKDFKQKNSKPVLSLSNSTSLSHSLSKISLSQNIIAKNTPYIYNYPIQSQFKTIQPYKTRDFNIIRPKQQHSVHQNISSSHQQIRGSKFKLLKTSDNIVYCFRMSNSQQSSFPRFKNFLQNKIPRLANDNRIRANLNVYGTNTGTRARNIRRDLAWGRGPTINATPLSGANGEFSPGRNSQELRINQRIVREYQRSGRGDRSAYELFLESTILHEYTHYLDDRDNTDRLGEEGQDFEQATYGRDIDSVSDARIVLRIRRIEGILQRLRRRRIRLRRSLQRLRRRRVRLRRILQRLREPRLRRRRIRLRRILQRLRRRRVLLRRSLQRLRRRRVLLRRSLQRLRSER